MTNPPSTFAEQVLAFNFDLQPDWSLPPGVELLYPYDNPETRQTMQEFYRKYYADQQERVFIFGINPGRFGAGITGVPFTDPIRLEEVCQIPNAFKKRSELSSIFVYEFVEAYGGPDAFYQKFYITSLCPLGFVKNGKNYNYYDDKALQNAVEPHIVDNINQQLKIGGTQAVALCMGQGKNYAYFKKLNEKHRFFGKILPLPHPRWVMQYRRKKMTTFVQSFLDNFAEAEQLSNR